MKLPSLSNLASALVLLLAALTGLLLFAPPFRRAVPVSTSASADSETGEMRMNRLEEELLSLSPRGYLIVVDTGANRLELWKGRERLLEALCSTGSGRQLLAGEQQWTFETPRGEFKILSKIRNPVWRKPDWAFLEEGKPVPENDRERFESGVLGEYALSFGKGYFIHGTLYNRLLGSNVTHGCIRLGSSDLIQISRKVPIGTPLYIF